MGPPLIGQVGSTRYQADAAICDELHELYGHVRVVLDPVAEVEEVGKAPVCSQASRVVEDEWEAGVEALLNEADRFVSNGAPEELVEGRVVSGLAVRAQVDSVQGLLEGYLDALELSGLCNDARDSLNALRVPAAKGP